MLTSLGLKGIPVAQHDMNPPSSSQESSQFTPLTWQENLARNPSSFCLFFSFIFFLFWFHCVSPLIFYSLSSYLPCVTVAYSLRHHCVKPYLLYIIFLFVCRPLVFLNGSSKLHYGIQTGQSYHWSQAEGAEHQPKAPTVWDLSW